MIRASHLKRIASATLGALPFVGAFASVLWMLWGSGSLQSRGVGALGDWAIGCATHPIGAIVLIQALYTGLQSLLWMRYRPFERPEGVVWPKVSVVIPAFNEGPMVERSIRSVARCAYPKELLEIIVVDDGSRDDTFFHMQRLRREFPDVVRLIRFISNRGKRAGLEAGFRAATGEIVVTIDSDSEIEAQTIHEMVTPFLVDPKIGGVAGRVAVLNRDSIISRMLEVQYALAFDFARAAQSTYRCVACCPGALSAFRREAIVPHLTEWTNQTFLGRPVGHGEDQALTNIVLRQGYDTVYQRRAVVHTLAPTTYGQLSRMFVRWDRSYIVEGFSFAKFMFSGYREKNRVLPVVTFIVSNMRLVLFAWGIVELPLVFTEDLTTLVHASIALAVGALFSAAYYLRIERSFRFIYGLLYALFSVCLLQWILPWALITVRDERWGTR
ncbi:glycosyltransferase [Pendulispora albinea]|uniref:Glycosyltransferase family 2 protein n=1 Tax=Pendulispora albinea TaxID=2741071 RepID=A0ABZ2M487_9BACT